MSHQVPQHLIDRANDRIVDVISGYLPALKKTGKDWSACCPFHQEKTPSFNVVEKGEGFFFCHGCGASGNTIGFVMQYNNVDFRTAVKSILGEIELEAASIAPRIHKPRAITCSLPGHAEDRERAAHFLSQAIEVDQHMYLARHNTASAESCLSLKGALIIPLINNIGETVNVAAISSKGITYAAGSPSFGSSAILEPAQEQDGRTIICIDYAHAWRIWWAQKGASRVLACMDAGNFTWMLAHCRDRFTHVGCDPMEADQLIDEGFAIVAVPLDPYTKLDRSTQAA